MIEWSLDALRACESVRRIVVAVPPERTGELALALSEPEGSASPPVTVVAGGASRAESVANALAAVETELVAIHDAARPLLRPALLETLLDALASEPGAAGVISAAPVADTLKRVGSNLTFPPNRAGNVRFTIDATVEREGLWGAQTPQVFRAEALRGALAAAGEDAATDEAMLVEATGGTVLLHHCREANFKVTTPLDLRLAELLLRDRG